jgi:hypothetical protein
MTSPASRRTVEEVGLTIHVFSVAGLAGISGKGTKGIQLLKSAFRT